ncbi:hypothetical protein Lepto7376_2750 [[Leptolyngbya] sp. PCC 7376]|uniref:GapS4a family protein n=1 Tax=[Leptolyngbya] sp. PCC 7376 TaxID=111781 RepID=UPI00029EE1F4|nr:hypothetical protein [[Leptolyngbya] sp. PCC 7376]AFY39010.1 hypothetical protein Lepto7376_2750 [[Leptolyngbya] sp. PCC 7376]
MGEWSKKVGERGEEIVRAFLRHLGWNNCQENIELTCLRKTIHKAETHGIDLLFSYPSPLIDDTLDNLIVSVKYTANGYPTSPNSTFKSHFYDLSKTIECFKRSSIRESLIRNFQVQNISNTRDIGVLFWLSNDSTEDNNDLISKICNARELTKYNFDTTYVVDNLKAEFIREVKSFLESQYSNEKIEFFYQNTGKNFNYTSRRVSGNTLPVECVNSNILLFRITYTENNTQILVLTILDKFSSKNLKRMMGLALEIGQGLTAKTLILFPDYDPLLHSNQVNEVKLSFVDQSFTNFLEVKSYKQNLRNI